jgi:hypothetical protein
VNYSDTPFSGVSTMYYYFDSSRWMGDTQDYFRYKKSFHHPSLTPTHHTSVTLKIHMYRANPKSVGKEHRSQYHDTTYFVARDTHIWGRLTPLDVMVIHQCYNVWLRLIKRCCAITALHPTPWPVFLSRLLISQAIRKTGTQIWNIGVRST